MCARVCTVRERHARSEGLGVGDWKRRAAARAVAHRWRAGAPRACAWCVRGSRAARRRRSAALRTCAHERARVPAQHTDTPPRAARSLSLGAHPPAAAASLSRACTTPRRQRQRACRHPPQRAAHPLECVLGQVCARQKRHRFAAGQLPVAVRVRKREPGGVQRRRVADVRHGARAPRRTGRTGGGAFFVLFAGQPERHFGEGTRVRFPCPFPAAVARARAVRACACALLRGRLRARSLRRPRRARPAGQVQPRWRRHWTPACTAARRRCTTPSRRA
jgi:hypothetical protein